MPMLEMVQNLNQMYKIPVEIILLREGHTVDTGPQITDGPRPHKT